MHENACASTRLDKCVNVSAGADVLRTFCSVSAFGLPLSNGEGTDAGRTGKLLSVLGCDETHANEWVGVGFVCTRIAHLVLGFVLVFGAAWPLCPLMSVCAEGRNQD